MLINGIVAMDNNRGIGKNNNLPWNLKSHLNRFQRIKIGNGNNALILGKNTWKSIKFLKRRDHLILSTTLNLHYKQDEKLVKSFKTIYDILDFIKVKGGKNFMSFKFFLLIMAGTMQQKLKSFPVFFISISIILFLDIFFFSKLKSKY